MLTNKEDSNEESDDESGKQSDTMVYLGNEVIYELNKYLLSPLTNIVNQYSCFRTCSGAAGAVARFISY